MLLRSKVYRENGTHIEMPGNRNYHFRFLPGLSDDPQCHIADVTHNGDLGRLLGLPDLFEIFNAPAPAPAPAPAMPPAPAGQPTEGDGADDGEGDEVPAGSSPAVAAPTFGRDWMKLATEGGAEGIEVMRAEYKTRFGKTAHPAITALKLAERLIEDEKPAA